MEKNLLIIGAGGHGKVVAEVAELEGRWTQIAFLDDNEGLTQVLGYPILGRINDYNNYSGEYKSAVVAIGNNKARMRWHQQLKEFGYHMPSIIHPRAFVSNSVKLGEGCVVLAGAVVSTDSEIGDCCIININASIDHDNMIESGVHISAGAVVKSSCKIGKMVNIGSNAMVKRSSVIEEQYDLAEGLVF